MKILDNHIHNEPPKTPVHSYHCTHLCAPAKALPRVSQGHVNSHRKCRYSKDSQYEIKAMYPRVLPSRFRVGTHNKMGMVCNTALAKLAKAPPASLAFPTHQVVSTFQVSIAAKTSNLKRHFRSNASFWSTSHNKGTSAKNMTQVVGNGGQASQRSAPDKHAAEISLFMSSETGIEDNEITIAHFRLMYRGISAI
jgi:hypothetical protein